MQYVRLAITIATLANLYTPNGKLSDLCVADYVRRVNINRGGNDARSQFELS